MARQSVCWVIYLFADICLNAEAFPLAVNDFSSLQISDVGFTRVEEVL